MQKVRQAVDAPVPRYAVLVLGMHRSGTSALSRVLSLIGCALPRNLMAANVNNETGYWESQAVAEFDEEVLASADSSWDDFRPFNANWHGSPLHADFARKGAQVLAQEYESSPLFVLKDPRICRLMPLWRDILAKAQLSPVVVLALRNPLEVARSLARRDGMDLGHAQLLWLRHVLDAEFASRDMPRAVTSYDQLLTDWKALADRLEQTFGFSWPRATPKTGMAINDFLHGQYRHEHHDLPNHGLATMAADWVRQTYSILLAWADQGENHADFAALDTIRTHFDMATQALATPLWGLITDRAALARTRAEQAAALTQSDANLAAVQGILVERDALLQAQEQALAQGHTDLDETRHRLAEVEHHLAQRDALLQTQDQTLAQSQAALDETRHRLAEMQSAAIQRSEEMAQAWGELDKERALSAQHQSAVADLADRLEEAENREAARADAELQALNRLTVQESAYQALDQERQTAEARAALQAEQARHYEQACVQAENRLREEKSTIEALRQTLLLKEEALAQRAAHAQWAGQVLSALAQRPFWWAFLSPANRRDQEYRKLASHHLFDRDSYLERYPDVAAACVDPLHHYMEWGMAEGRTPLP